MLLDENCRLALYEHLTCVNRWLQKAPAVVKNNILPFTATEDINDAILINHRTADDQSYERTYQAFDCSSASTYFSVFESDSGSSFNDEQTNEYFAKLIKKTKPGSDVETKLEQNEIAWKPTSSGEKEDTFIIGDDLKTQEEMRKLEELDDPNRIWTNNRGAEKFIQQKIQNILEFQELCRKSK